MEIGSYVPFRSKYIGLGIFNSLVACMVLAHRPNILITNFLDYIKMPMVVLRFYAMPEYATTRVYLFLLLTLILFPVVIGGLAKSRFAKYQKSIDLLKLGDEENKPKVIEVIPEEELKTVIKIKSPGISLEKFQARRGDFQAAFNQTVEEIRAEDNSPNIINLSISRYPLPSMVTYESHVLDLKNEGEFMIGQSRRGFILQNIAELPHMLVAGTSGSGKSTFFKQALLGLMKTSPDAKFFLIDLKRGAELGIFSGVPGVRVAKSIEDAVNLLREAKEQMQRRFDILEQRGISKIIPDEHKIPRIVVAIDEASELISIPSRTNPKKDLMLEAREITNDIAKLGRAAAINLLVATQKVHKSIIDTALQENLGGRMAFRMATLANSASVLGSKGANNLSANPGRSLWQFGLKTLEVQPPFIEEKKIKHLIADLKEKRAAFSTNDKELKTQPQDNKEVEWEKLERKNIDRRTTEGPPPNSQGTGNTV